MALIKKYKKGGVLIYDGKRHEYNEELDKLIRENASGKGEDAEQFAGKMIDSLKRGESITYDSSLNQAELSDRFVNSYQLTERQKGRASRRTSAAGDLLDDVSNSKTSNLKDGVSSLRTLSFVKPEEAKSEAKDDNSEGATKESSGENTSLDQNQGQNQNQNQETPNDNKAEVDVDQDSSSYLDVDMQNFYFHDNSLEDWAVKNKLTNFKITNFGQTDSGSNVYGIVSNGDKRFIESKDGEIIEHGMSSSFANSLKNGTSDSSLISPYLNPEKRIRYGINLGDSNLRAGHAFVTRDNVYYSSEIDGDMYEVHPDYSETIRNKSVPQFSYNPSSVEEFKRMLLGGGVEARKLNELLNIGSITTSDDIRKRLAEWKDFGYNFSDFRQYKEFLNASPYFNPSIHKPRYEYSDEEGNIVYYKEGGTTKKSSQVIKGGVMYDLPVSFTQKPESDSKNIVNTENEKLNNSDIDDSEFTTEDILDLTSIAADAVAVGLSMSGVPVAGGVAGLASAGTAFAADLQDGFDMEDGVSLASNIALGVISGVPVLGAISSGAKLFNRISKASKVLTKAFALAGATDASLAMYSMIEEGDWNIQDMQRVIGGLTTIAGSRLLKSAKAHDLKPSVKTDNGDMELSSEQLNVLSKSKTKNEVRNTLSKFEDDFIKSSKKEIDRQIVKSKSEINKINKDIDNNVGNKDELIDKRAKIEKDIANLESIESRKTDWTNFDPTDAGFSNKLWGRVSVNTKPGLPEKQIVGSTPGLKPRIKAMASNIKHDYQRPLVPVQDQILETKSTHWWTGKPIEKVVSFREYKNSNPEGMEWDYKTSSWKKSMNSSSNLNVDNSLPEKPSKGPGRGFRFVYNEETKKYERVSNLSNKSVPKGASGMKFKPINPFLTLNPVTPILDTTDASYNAWGISNPAGYVKPLDSIIGRSAQKTKNNSIVEALKGVKDPFEKQPIVVDGNTNNPISKSLKDRSNLIEPIGNALGWLLSNKATEKAADISVKSLQDAARIRDSRTDFIAPAYYDDSQYVKSELKNQLNDGVPATSSDGFLNVAQDLAKAQYLTKAFGEITRNASNNYRNYLTGVTEIHNQNSSANDAVAMQNNARSRATIQNIGGVRSGATLQKGQNTFNFIKGLASHWYKDTQLDAARPMNAVMRHLGFDDDYRNALSKNPELTISEWLENTKKTKEFEAAMQAYRTNFKI